MTTFQTPRAGERMLPVEEAQQRVLDEITLIGTEQVVFTESLGRVSGSRLSKPVSSRLIQGTSRKTGKRDSFLQPARVTSATSSMRMPPQPG